MSECGVCGRTRRSEPHPYCDAIEAELHALRDVAEAAEFMLGCLPCRCGEAFKSRRLQDPFCPCDDLEAVRIAVEAWKRTAAPTTKR